jgi:hypothetical protein
MAKLPKFVCMEGRIFRLKGGPIRREPNGRASVRLDLRYLGKVQGEG